MIWRCKRTLPPLLVRIMHKSRLRYFGKPEKKIAMPYQAYFEVADHSGMMSLVLWNSLCPEWFRTLRVGNVLLLQQYAVKTSYPNRTLPTPGDSQVKRLPSLEISLNARDPPSTFNIIPEKLVKPEWRLPDVKYQFITRLELNKLPHNRVCDVIGLVTYVGRGERIRKRDDSEDFWLYRWVQMIDGTTDQPFLLEIFATSQPDVFEQIHPMSYLVCTQMRVIRECPENAPSTAYLTTSNESQVFISGCHKGQPYTTDHRVKRFIDWIRTQREADLMKKTVIGGYHPHPVTPATFSQYCKDNKVQSILTTFNDLKKAIANLHYREHKRLAIQGMITALRFVQCSNVTEDTSERETCQSSGNTGRLSKDQVQKGQRGSSELHVQHQQTRKRPHQAVVSRKGYFTRSAKEWNNHFVAPEKNNVVHEVSNELDTGVHEKHSIGAEQSADDVVESAMKETPRGPWESTLWSDVKDTIEEHLRYSNVFPESIPRKFDYFHKEFLMYQYNLHPAKMSAKPSLSNGEIQEFKTADVLGHYELTILGINQKVAIDVLSLPVFCSEDPPVFGINYVPNGRQFPCASDTDGSANMERTDQQRLALHGELVQFVKSLDRLHVICILDICHLGGNEVEVCLNRVYNPIGNAKADVLV
ncbi:hypothetical protein FKM82_002508 [Ascaphus truei]